MLAKFIESRIYLIRRQKVMLDSDLAELYGVETKALNRAVRRNINRFPKDFMFKLTTDELKDVLRYQFGTSNLKSEVILPKDRRGGRRYMPFAFTQEGVAMLSGILRSERAVKVNIAIMRAFVRLRNILASHKDLARKLEALEKKYNKNFQVIFKAIHELMRPEEDDEKQIGFRT